MKTSARRRRRQDGGRAQVGRSAGACRAGFVGCRRCPDRRRAPRRPPSRRRRARAARRLGAPVAGPEVEVGGNRLHVRVTPGDGDAEPAAVRARSRRLGAQLDRFRRRAARPARDRLRRPARSRPVRPGAAATTTRSRAHADAVIGYIEQRDRGPVHLAGNSMGGAISMLVAAQRPDLVRTLTLISPAVPDNRLRLYPLRNDPRMAAADRCPVLGECGAKRFNRTSAAEVRVAGTIELCFADKTRYPRAAARRGGRRGAGAAGHAVGGEPPCCARCAAWRCRSSCAAARRWAAMRAHHRADAGHVGRQGPARRAGPRRLRRRGDPGLAPARPRGHRSHGDDGGPGTTARAMLALLEDAART